LCEQSVPAIPNAHNSDILRERHPVDPCPSKLSELPDPASTNPLQITEAEVVEAIRSFPAGSAGRPDGFRPSHLLDLLGHRETAPALIGALTDFSNLLLRGGCPQGVRAILFGGNLIALTKDGGGLRPIAVGYVWRRLVAKCANKYALSRLSGFFAPLQLGIGVPGGCEATIHSTRRFVAGMPLDHVVVKLDFANAFNSLRRDTMLESLFTTIPELYQFVHQCYAAPSVLKFGQHVVSSQMGPQQGDPLGPLLFCLPLQPALQSLKSDLRIGFLDDLTLGGDPSAVAQDIQYISTLETSLGLRLNRQKCEILMSEAAHSLDPRWSDFSRRDHDSLTLLGAPLFRGAALDASLSQHCNDLQRAFTKLGQLPSQNALTLLRSSFGSSKLGYLLRCSPCADHRALQSLDSIMRTGLELIVNTSFNDIQWLQATLPVRDGGLGLRRVVSLASSAYLASAAATLELQMAILGGSALVPDVVFDDLLLSRQQTLPTVMSPLPTRQNIWDRPLIEMDKTRIHLWPGYDNPVDQARLTAICSPHSGDWLAALPIPSCGLTLDNEAVRIAVGLRLGLDICSPHTCRCGALVGANGHHGFVCKQACGRSLRHFTINDIIWRALSRADVPCTKEPVGLFRSDGKRPDGATLIPWSEGRYLAWDATVVHSCALSYVTHPAGSRGPASAQAAERKDLKYQGLPPTHKFQALAFETLGPINLSGAEFISSIGSRISIISGDRREASFLFQRLSVCIQRYNSVTFNGTFPATPDDEA